MTMWSLGRRVGTVTTANAAVAGLGFLGSGLLLPSALEPAAFAAASLFLAAFQCLQEVMGRSLNWALLRLHPTVAREHQSSGDQMLLAARSLQRRMMAAGCGLAAMLVLAAYWLLDKDGETSRALVLGLATSAAVFGVLIQFELGVLQLRERFGALALWMVANSSVRLLAWTLLWATGLLSLPTSIAAHVVTTAAIALGVRRAAGPLPMQHLTVEGEAHRVRLLHFGGRMVLATALASTAAQIDLFLLDARADDATTGRLRIAVLFATVLELATSAVMTTLLPQAGRAQDANDRAAMMRRSLKFGGAIALLAAISLPLVSFALPRLLPQYAGAADLYPIIVLGVMLTAVTDPLGLSFVSQDRPGRFVALNALLLLVVVLGNLLAPGEDRAAVTAWVRTAGRATLACGIVILVLRDCSTSRLAQKQEGEF